MKREKKSRLQQSWIPYLIMILTIFVPRVIFSFWVYPIRLPMDEMGTIAGAAHFAGLDWSEVISQGSYYGNGFSALLAPIFKLTDNPYLIYHLVNVVYSLIYLGIGFIIYHLTTIYFEIQNRWFACTAAIAGSYLLAYRATTFSNEHPLTLIAWLTAWLLMSMVKNDEDIRRKRRNTFLLVLLLAYSLTVHTRAVTYWIALAVLIVLYRWRYGKWIVSWGTLAVCGIPGSFLSQRFVHYIQNQIWVSEGGKELANATISVSMGGIDLADPATWKAWLFIILGQLNTMLIFTAGIQFLACMIVFGICFRGVFLKKREIEIAEAGAVWERADCRFFYAVGGYFLCCMLITIAGQSITWLGGAVASIQDGYGTKLTSVKAFTYVRYFSCYAGPVLLMGLVYLYEYGEKLKKYVLLPFVLGYAALQFVWVRGILRYIYRNGNGAEGFRPFSLMESGTSMKTYMPAVIITAVLMAVIVWSLYKKKWKPVLLILVLSLFYQYAYKNVVIDRNASLKYRDRTNAGCELIREMEEKGEAPERIYVVDTREIAHKSYYVYQYYLNRYQVIPMTPEDSCEEGAMILSNDEIPEFEERGYTCRQLDENEYLYLAGD